MSATPAYPPDLRVELDARAQITGDGNRLIGGEPLRAVTLSQAGATALSSLVAGVTPHSPTAARLARMLVDRGLAHPRPAPAPLHGRVTVVIPTRDRPEHLDRCLACCARTPTIVVDDGSSDPDAVREVCAAHGALRLRHEQNQGPAAARATGMRAVTTELVAFLDDDCAPPRDWLQRLIGHFDDPRVGAVTPRIIPCPTRARTLAAVAAARSGLDLGPAPARVIPGSRVAYVPTAALVTRTELVRRLGFDRALRVGEDVDLVWRLHDSGWTTRYDPSVHARHREPGTAAALATRRFRYGTSAALLAERHPGRLVPLRVHVTQVPMLAALAGGGPAPAISVAAASTALTALRLRRAQIPLAAAARLAVRAHVSMICAAGRAGTALVAPVVACGLLHRRTRPAAAILLAASPACEWITRRPALDPLRWSLLCIADELAYGAGVWAGALRARNLEPVLPVIGR